MKWSAQFDQYGKKIIRTSQPCVATLDPATGGNPSAPTPPANSYRFGAMTVSNQGNGRVVFVQTLNALQGSSTCNISTLLGRLTNNLGSEGATTRIQGVTQLTVFSSDALTGFSSIGSMQFVSSSQATYRTNSMGYATEIELILTNVSVVSSAFQPAPAENWYINGVSSCP